MMTIKDGLKRLSQNNRNHIEYDVEAKKELIESTFKKLFGGIKTGSITDTEKKKLHGKLCDLFHQHYEYDSNKTMQKKFYKAYIEVFQTRMSMKYIQEDMKGDVFISIDKTVKCALKYFDNNYEKYDDTLSFFCAFNRNYYYRVIDYFLKIINDNLMERSDINSSSSKLNHKIKLDMIKNALREILNNRIKLDWEIKEHYRNKINNIKYLNKEKILDLALGMIKSFSNTELTAKESYEIDELNKLLSSDFILSDIKSNDDFDGVMYLSDKPLALDSPILQDKNKYMKQRKEANILKLTRLLDDDSPIINDKNNILMCTIIINVLIMQYEYIYENNLYFDAYKDENFRQYFKNRYTDIEKVEILDNLHIELYTLYEIAADYMNKKVDTIRKYPKNIRNKYTEAEKVKDRNCLLSMYSIIGER